MNDEMYESDLNSLAKYAKEFYRKMNKNKSIMAQSHSQSEHIYKIEWNKWLEKMMWICAVWPDMI